MCITNLCSFIGMILLNEYLYWYEFAQIITNKSQKYVPANQASSIARFGFSLSAVTRAQRGGAMSLGIRRDGLSRVKLLSVRSVQELPRMIRPWMTLLLFFGLLLLIVVCFIVYQVVYDTSSPSTRSSQLTARPQKQARPGNLSNAVVSGFRL